MATRYAVGSGLWSDTSSVWSDTDGGAAGSYVPVDGDTVVICAGVEVQVDVDQSAWTGLASVTVRAGATPGMIYWKDGQSGTLRINGNLQGNSATNSGRVLANSDGDWDTDTPLSYSNHARIIGGSLLAYMNQLSIRMIPTEPTRKYVRPYGTKYDFNGATAVDTTNNTIDLGTSPPSAGTTVMVTSASGTLPAPLIEDCIYYVRTVSGNTCKLAYKNSDGTVIDIMAVGSGTCTLFTGCGSGSATVNVLEDVTADNWTAGDRVVLCNTYGADVQFLTADTINAGSIVLSGNVDSAQYPGARLYLSQRNCSLHRTTAAAYVAAYDNGAGNILGEVSTVAASGANILHEVASSVGTKVSIVCGGNVSLNSCAGVEVDVVCGAANGISGGRYYEAGFAKVGEMFGVTNGINRSRCNDVGLIGGCSYGITNYSRMNKVGKIIGASSYAVQYGYGNTIDHVFNCAQVFYLSEGNNLGVVVGTTGDPVYASVGGVVWCKSNPDDTLYNDYVTTSYETVAGSQKINHGRYATVITAAGGAGTPVPDQRSGGSATLISFSWVNEPYVASAGFFSPWLPGYVKVWAAASESKTYRFYIQSTYALTAKDIDLTARYWDGGYAVHLGEVVSDETIDARSGITDWSQYLEVAVNPGRAGWVELDIHIRKYTSGGVIYIDPQMVIS